MNKFELCALELLKAKISSTQFDSFETAAKQAIEQAKIFTEMLDSHYVGLVKEVGILDRKVLETYAKIKIGEMFWRQYPLGLAPMNRDVGREAREAIAEIQALAERGQR